MELPLRNAYKHTGEFPQVRIRCPRCKQLGVFEHVPGIPDVMAGTSVHKTPRDEQPASLGQRTCPNEHCKAHIFFVRPYGGSIYTYPAERIDFDHRHVPNTIVQSLEEAITCHANQCYRSAAMMVRRALEELCEDRGATGKNLQERIKALAGKVVMPDELLDGIDQLRLLGNDGAHVEAKVFDQIGKTEIELAIDVSREVLKAVYQYKDLIDRLRAQHKIQQVEQTGDDGRS